MEISILEKTDSSIKIRVKGGSQSILNLLKEEADSVPGVTFAGFVIEHPLDKSSVFVIKTEDKDAEKVFKKVIDKTEEDLKAAKKQFLSLL
jgi:DNA-directed RNA polymerase subunit L